MNISFNGKLTILDASFVKPKSRTFDTGDIMNITSHPAEKQARERVWGKGLGDYLTIIEAKNDKGNTIAHLCNMPASLLTKAWQKAMTSETATEAIRSFNGIASRFKLD